MPVAPSSFKCVRSAHDARVKCLKQRTKLFRPTSPPPFLGGRESLNQPKPDPHSSFPHFTPPTHLIRSRTSSSSPTSLPSMWSASLVIWQGVCKRHDNIHNVHETITRHAQGDGGKIRARRAPTGHVCVCACSAQSMTMLASGASTPTRHVQQPQLTSTRTRTDTHSRHRRTSCRFAR